MKIIKEAKKCTSETTAEPGKILLRSHFYRVQMTSCVRFCHLPNWLIDTTKRHFFFISFFLCTCFFFSQNLFFFSGDHLEVHYEGRLDDENGKKFDASRDRGNLFKFQLGAGQVLLDSLQNHMINDLKI